MTPLYWIVQPLPSGATEPLAQAPTRVEVEALSVLSGLLMILPVRRSHSALSTPEMRSTRSGYGFYVPAASADVHGPISFSRARLSPHRRYAAPARVRVGV